MLKAKDRVSELLYKNEPQKVAEMFNTSKVYNADEIVSVIGISKHYLKILYENGKFPKPITKAGRYWLWSHEDYEKIINTEM